MINSLLGRHGRMVRRVGSLIATSRRRLGGGAKATGTNCTCSRHASKGPDVCHNFLPARRLYGDSCAGQAEALHDIGAVVTRVATAAYPARIDGAAGDGAAQAKRPTPPPGTMWAGE